MHIRLTLLLLLIPCTLVASPQVAATQQVKDVQTERFVVQAMTKSFLGYHEEAIALYKKALELSPASPVVNSSIAEEYEKLEDFPTAIYYATQARDFSPKNPHFHQHLAKLYAEQGDTASAEQALEQMLRQFPENTQALEDLAYLQYSSAQYDKALASYRELERQIGPQERISYILLQINYERDDTAGMEEALLELERQDPANPTVKRNLAELYAQNSRQNEAIQVLEKVLMMDSSDVETIVPLAKLYEARGLQEKADALWLRAMQASGTPEDAFSRASHLYTRASEHPETLDVVIKLLEYAIAQDPTYAEALVLLGTIRFEEYRFQEAGELLYQAVQINPRSPDAWLQSAAAYLRAGQPKSAAEIADEALMLFPGQVSLLRVAAYGYMDSYANDRSIERFLEFYELLKEDPAQITEQSEILSALGLLYTRVKNYPASDSMYAAAIKLAPDNAIVLNNLAYSFAERSHALEKALDYATRAVQLDENNPSFMDTLGWVYFKSGKFKVAEQWIEKAINAGAQTATTYEHLGDIQIKLGKSEAAVVSWTKSLQLNPENNLLKEKINQNQ